MRKIKIVTDNDELYNADQAVKSFIKNHGKKFNEDEHKELGHLLRNRAKALSKILGTEVGSVADDDWFIIF